MLSTLHSLTRDDYHLVCDGYDRGGGKLPAALVHELFQTETKQFDDQNVVVSLLTVPVEVRDARSPLHGLVYFRLIGKGVALGILGLLSEGKAAGRTIFMATLLVVSRSTPIRSGDCVTGVYLAVGALADLVAQLVFPSESCAMTQHYYGAI